MNEKQITGGLCWVRLMEIENAGVHRINPDRGHIAEDFEPGDWQLPIYQCKLCGCLFGKTPTAESDTGDGGHGAG